MASGVEVVAIAGAAGGVGRATAVEFARRGACVGLIARGMDGLLGAAKEVEQAGGTACICPADVADAAQVEAAATRIEAELGPITIWVNDAMTTVFSRFMDLTAEEFQRVTEVTYLGTVHGTMAALKRMAPRTTGV